MNRITLLLLSCIPLLLAGCGMVAAFVPPIEVGDTLGVEGQTVTATFAGDGASGLTAQGTSSAESTVERTFDDVELDLRGFSLAGLNARIGMDADVVLTAPPEAAEFPAELTITGVGATARVSDDVNGSAALSMERDVDLTFVLDRASCEGVACTYRFAGGDEELSDVLSITAGQGRRSVLATFVAVVRLERLVSTNTGRFTLRVAADAEPDLDGFSATFTLRSNGTKIEVGG